MAPDGVAGSGVSKYLALTLRVSHVLYRKFVQAKISNVERGASDAIGEGEPGCFVRDWLGGRQLVRWTCRKLCTIQTRDITVAASKQAGLTSATDGAARVEGEKGERVRSEGVRSVGWVWV